jgi:hypothetical protein
MPTLRVLQSRIPEFPAAADDQTVAKYQSDFHRSVVEWHREYRSLLNTPKIPQLVAPNVFTGTMTVNNLFAADSGTLTGAAATPHTFNQTWNNGTTAFRCLTISATDTASAAGSWLLNLKTGANSVAHIDKVGVVAAAQNTAIPAGGAQAISVSTTAAMGVYFGSGAPTISAAQGSLYLRSDGSATNNRAYINTNGSTTWTALTTAA